MVVQNDEHLSNESWTIKIGRHPAQELETIVGLINNGEEDKR